MVVLVGRPNVGKSTLFNRLTQSREALVADFPGLTRDRQYGFVEAGERRFIVVDTGGLDAGSDPLAQATQGQSEMALGEADVIVFLVDHRSGLLPGDQTIAQQLRELNKPTILAVNKSEGVAVAEAQAEFFALGMPGEPLPIAATSGRGLGKLHEALAAQLPASSHSEPAENEMILAVVGRPNVGKSTFINRLAGSDRVVTSDVPGTTRDSVEVPIERDGHRFTLIDTAGVRRRAKIERGVEQWSVAQTLRAIDTATVVVALLDARAGVTEQDLHLLGTIVERGRALVVGLNKWDGLGSGARRQVQREVDRLLPFVSFAQVEPLSAKFGSRIAEVLTAAAAAHEAAGKDLATADLNRVLGAALEAHPPPLVRGRRPRPRYAHQGGKRPPRIIVHGTGVERLPEHYLRYLTNTFRRAFQLAGTPVWVQVRQGDNPFAGRRNRLTPRQERKRARLMKRVKKGK